MLIVKLDSASNGLGEAEPRGLGDGAAQLLPHARGDVFGHQRVFRLDLGERLTHAACVCVEAEVVLLLQITSE